MSEELRPCPFCGVSLIPCTDQNDLFVRRYGTHYDHPKGTCFLADIEVTPSQVSEWNRRAASREVQEAEREAIKNAVEAIDWYEKHMPPNLQRLTANVDARDDLASLLLPGALASRGAEGEDRG